MAAGIASTGLYPDKSRVWSPNVPVLLIIKPALRFAWARGCQGGSRKAISEGPSHSAAQIVTVNDTWDDLWFDPTS